MIRTFHMVRLEAAIDWLRCGWLPTPILDGTHHGQWSVAMEWVCACPPAFVRSQP